MRRTPARVLAAMVGAALSTLSCGAKTELEVTQRRFRLLSIFTHQTCAVDELDNVFCWGTTGGTDRMDNPPTLIGQVPSLEQLAVGPNSVCALDANGTVFCAGNNAYGALGVPGPSRVHFERVASLPPVRIISRNIHGYTVLTRDGQWLVWGGAFEPIGLHGRSVAASPMQITVERPIETLHPDVPCVTDDARVVHCLHQLTAENEHITATTMTVPLAADETLEYVSGRPCQRAERRLRCPTYVSDPVEFSIPSEARSFFLIGARATELQLCMQVGHELQCTDATTRDPRRARNSRSLANGRIVQDLPPMRTLATGYAHACAITTDDRVRCWGTDHDGELGLGIARTSAVPTIVEGLSDSVNLLQSWNGVIAVHPTSIEARGNAQLDLVAATSPSPLSWSATTLRWSIQPAQRARAGVLTENGIPCILDASNRISCIDRDGVGTPLEFSPPLDVPIDAISSCMAASVIAIRTSDARAFGVSATTLAPQRLVEIRAFAGALSVAAADRQVCAVLSDHSVRCVSTDALDAPAREMAVPPSDEVAAGIGQICAIHRDRTVSCWGRTAHMRFADFNERSAILQTETPRAIDGLRDVQSLNLDSIYTACAVHRDGRVSCWGNNEALQAGQPVARAWIAPTIVEGVTNVRSVHALDAQSCAVRTDGAVLCWGRLSAPDSQIGSVPASDRALLVALP